MLWDGETHEDIARKSGVCTRTIDREAAFWDAHTATVTAAIGASVFPPSTKGRVQSVRIGEAVGGNPEAIAAEAERIASGLMTDGLLAEIREAEAEALRIMSEAEPEVSRIMAAIDSWMLPNRPARLPQNRRSEGKRYPSTSGGRRASGGL